jgi:pimeloyl-ACP methyl ester carboxylesterase
LEQTEPIAMRTSVGRIAGFTAGDGPLVILVHGLGERAAALGGFISPLTEAGFRVVGLDLPGHGESAGQMNNPIKSAAAVREIADHLGGAHAVIAHSLGGHAALWAMNEGLAVERAVLIAPNVDMSYATKTFQFLFGLSDKAMDGLKRKIERRYGPDIWHDLSGEHLARSIEAPGLVVHDPEDPQVPFEGSERLVRKWRAARLIEAPELGHGTITRDPSVIERAVTFVAEPALSGGSLHGVPVREKDDDEQGQSEGGARASGVRVVQ